jgi:hypothetical protein
LPVCAYPKKTIHTNIEGKRARGKPGTRRINQIRMYIKMIGEN